MNQEFVRPIKLEHGVGPQSRLDVSSNPLRVDPITSTLGEDNIDVSGDTAAQVPMPLADSEHDRVGGRDGPRDVPALLNTPLNYIIVNRPNNRIAILSNTVPCQLVLRNAETGDEIRTKSMIDLKSFPSFSTDGQYLIVSVDGYIKVFDALSLSDPEAHLILPPAELSDEGENSCPLS